MNSLISHKNSLGLQEFSPLVGYEIKNRVDITIGWAATYMAAHDSSLQWQSYLFVW